MSVSHPELNIFMGLPAAGKTSFYKARFIKTHARINLDTLKSRLKEASLFAEYRKAKQSIVIDNTNLTIQDRKRYIPSARKAGYYIKGYFFKPAIEECLIRNAKRKGKGRVPDAVIKALHGRCKIPVVTEGFDELFTVYLMPNKKFRIARIKLS
jgi:predicted kinase